MKNENMEICYFFISIKWILWAEILTIKIKNKVNWIIYYSKHWITIAPNSRNYINNGLIIKTTNKYYSSISNNIK